MGLATFLIVEAVIANPTGKETAVSERGWGGTNDTFPEGEWLVTSVGVIAAP